MTLLAGRSIPCNSKKKTFNPIDITIKVKGLMGSNCGFTYAIGWSRIAGWADLHMPSFGSLQEVYDWLDALLMQRMQKEGELQRRKMILKHTYMQPEKRLIFHFIINISF
mgnify:CR=1 FL=1